MGLAHELRRMADQYETTMAAADRMLVENERLRAALEMIAGRRQCLDNLLGNVEIARQALDREQEEEPGVVGLDGTRHPF